MSQIDIFDEIIVDNFAGGGGASTGSELAAGRPVAIAINHDPDAILLHKTNHPYTEHLQASVWDVDPVEVCRGRPVGLAWFSPDCKHFSKAKGAPLVDRKIRGLSWVILRWAMTVRPRVMMMENVEEIQSWGPLMEIWINEHLATVPDPSRKGETFDAFIGMLTTGVPADHPALEEACEFLQVTLDSPEAKRLINGLGYVIEYRELVAADYGAPTTRKRFVLVARCDGKPIVWPERTHAPRDSEEVKSGKLKPWRAAAEIIDWDLPRYSIFASKQEIKEKYGVNAIRPLADNTLRRVIRGVDKFTIKSGKPFIVPMGYGERKGQAPRVMDIEEPVGTVVARDKFGVCDPVMEPFTFSNTGGSIGSPASEPVHTIRSAGGQVLASAQLMSIGQTGGGDRIRDVREPVPTAVSKQEACVVAANLIQYHTEQTENVRAAGLSNPIPTVDAANRHGLVSAQLVEYYGNGNPLDVAQPLHTVTAHDREALVCAHIDKYFNGEYKGCGDRVGDPLSTVTALPRHGLCAAHMVKFKGQELGESPEDPLPTITAQSCAGGHAVCCAVLAKTEPGRDLGHWPKIRELLNKYCGYDLKDDEVVLLIIRGIAYFIADIELRMLTPRELYSAMSFPVDYIIERDYLGNEYPKSKQVARCGNAVCCVLAEAMVRANFPEWCQRKITTMEQFHDAVAV